MDKGENDSKKRTKPVKKKYKSVRNIETFSWETILHLKVFLKNGMPFELSKKSKCKLPRTPKLIILYNNRRNQSQRSRDKIRSKEKFYLHRVPMSSQQVASSQVSLPLQAGPIADPIQEPSSVYLFAMS